MPMKMPSVLMRCLLLAPSAGTLTPGGLRCSTCGGSLDFMMSGISEISSATVMPASARRAIFSAAVSSLPSTIVPAWPKLMPGISSMKRPAMKATIGIRQSLSMTHARQLGLHAPAGLGVDDDALACACRPAKNGMSSA